MHKLTLIRCAVLAAAAGLGGTSQAIVAWDEGLAGDLSGDGLAPTVIAMGLGSNQVLGSSGRLVAGGAVDRDYFSINVPAGQWLSAVTLLPGTTFLGPLGLSFIGLQAGSQVTLPTNAATADGLLGWWHYGPTDINHDLLALMAVPNNGSTGFTPPLGAGQYAFWVQETGVGTVSYGLDLVLSNVPEPAAPALLLAGLSWLAWSLRRRS